MSRAILSVSDKRGLVEFARGLAELGFELVSTGGTARTLRDAGLDTRDVSDITGHPEMMEGRVKTLHPAVHAGILARAEPTGDFDALREMGYGPVDLVAVNLYPFHEAVATGADIPGAMEKVDIGGPTMLRAAAKNHARVLAIVDPFDYGRVLEALGAGEAGEELRRELARKVFAHTAAYDAAIARYFTGADGAGTWPPERSLRLSLVQTLRYGENPDQAAVFYAEESAPPDSLPHLRQRHGRELSFNNLLDIDAAIASASAFAGDDGPACVIVKHTTPCGVALGDTAADAFARALSGDPVSAFGGIIALNVEVDGAAAEAIGTGFFEIVVAPSFDAIALETLTRKKNLRLIEAPMAVPAAGELDYKRVRGGFLVQDRMRLQFDESEWRVATSVAPTAEQMTDLRFAWRVVAGVKSNAIVIARDGRTIGIGAGQMSRVDSSRIAVMKAVDQDAILVGSVLASDAFFPFRDGVDAAASAGVSAIIQPGGSVRDEEVIGAADEHGIAMVFTGRRVFRH